ncbi:ArnT family glycosyltransferase [Aureispira anguillae]|uniref:Glycosyltransferase family 39 protein n=1 Tax=Aureispira anguillae TaxID=2864201 RepID=A0A915YJ13_9BACT|nr:glycosyltransferase family 39 protein [Aureispira anguillae]BDS14084.1 glycosyltransferase family 39 protein [Aureispira anguillae]
MHLLQQRLPVLKKINSISILVGVLSLILIGQYLFCHGMFVDGLVYGTLARNYALAGEGWWDFWVYLGDPFHSHPPLAFWLQSLLFSVFGDFFWIDRLYSIFCLIVSLSLIKKLWQHLVPSFPQGAYWVQLLYLILPLVHWGFNNNVLENTSNCFILMSIWMYLLAQDHKQYRYSIVAGLAVFAATLTKGPTGLFPLIFPLLYYKHPFKQICWNTAIPILVLVLSWGMLIGSSTEAALFFSDYLDIQLVKSLSGEYGTVNRFLILEKLLLQLVVLIPVGIGLRIFFKQKSQHQAIQQQGWVFLFLGLSGSLPIMISPKQMSFYLLPSLIYFVVSFACFHLKQLEALDQIVQKQKIIRWVGSFAIICLLGITISSYGSFSRDKEILHDTFILGQLVSPNSFVKASDPIKKDWALHAYSARYFQINIHFSPKRSPFQITTKGELIPKGYLLVPQKTIRYNFYKKK